MSRSHLSGTALLSAALLLGAAPRPSSPQVVAPTPVLWVHADLGREDVAHRAGPVVGALVSALLGQEMDATVVERAPDLGWWSLEDAATDGVRIGLDLNALRAGRPELFDDQRLNQALLELGLANARGVVLECDLFDAVGRNGGTAQLAVSYRDWDSGAAEAIGLSPGRAPAVAGSGRIAITPAWQEWIDSAIAARRAMLDPLRRSPFDAELESWQRRHEQKLRQVTASLDGPILIGAIGEEAYGLIGVGPRADMGTLQRNLGIVLAPLGVASFDPRSSLGRVRVDALAGTELESLGLRVIEMGGKRWVLVTREGAGDTVADALSE
jgi:hypothetical protein